MPKTKQQKQDTVAKLTDKLGRSKSVVFANYQGMTMGQLAELRQKLNEQEAEFSVTKNNLLEIALKNAELEMQNAEVLKGPVATLFAYGDEISPIKSLTEAIKTNQVGEIKGGVLNGEFLNEQKVKQLADLPSKDQLRAKVVGTVAAPLYGLVNVMQGNLRNLVYVMDAIRIRRLAEKGGE